MNFKVGDLCVLVLAPNSVWNGQEVIVTAGPERYRFKKLSDGLEFSAIGYLVVDSQGMETAQLPEELRLKRQPNKDDAEPRTDFTPGEWDLCPFNPYKQKERA
jgi:hypothetical protein